ncbi:MAG: hypothetical protein M1814_003299 [Vezdaea aestivalis]|nr:MAG: hypothetical protein M1814_003299 [Vezdaea aestivalis]
MSSEAYRKVGRGGAGNFYTKSDIAKQEARLSADVEAQTAPLTSSETMQSVAATPSSQNAYAHMGRGGAGNFYSPKDLPVKGEFSGQVDGTAPSVGQVEVTRGYVGRGGAGNYTSAERRSGEQRRSGEGKRSGEQRRSADERRIAQDVEQGLEKPEKAATRV